MENNQPIYMLSTDLFLYAKTFGLLNVFWLRRIEKRKGSSLTEKALDFIFKSFVFCLFYIVLAFPDLTY